MSRLLDLSSDPNSANRKETANNDQKRIVHAENSSTKKFLGVKFHCCGVYSRVYVNSDNSAYEGRCPKCLKPVKLKIGEGGTDSRFFEVF
ncbi:MAG: hypothetical protein LBT05_06490 [Planctomycetaceae bacterium]|jgi:hypothetical protein|nr:hypothetical protein [Planctomycetaceae bacterium]